MAPHAPHMLPLELHPALRTHLREHFGALATPHPHCASTAPCYLQPKTELGIMFHDLPLLPTYCGAIVAGLGHVELGICTRRLAHVAGMVYTT